MTDSRLVDPDLPSHLEESFLQKHATEDLLQTWLYKAYERNDLTSIKKLRKFGADQTKAEPATGTFSIQAVCMNGHHERLNELLKNEKCDVEVTLCEQENLLHLACYCGDKKTVGILLTRLGKEIINGRATKDQTPIMIAVIKEDHDLVKQLLGSKKIDQNIYDEDNCSVQNIAYDNELFEVVETLVKVSDLETLNHLDNNNWSIGMHAFYDRKGKMLGIINSRRESLFDKQK